MSETIYRFTTSDMRSKHGVHVWEVGERHAIEWGGRLCQAGALHAYRHPALAIIMDPVHGGYGPDAKLWEAETEVVLADDGMKIGCADITLTRQIERPQLTTDQLVEFAIRVALLVYKDEGFVDWAGLWLSGMDRSAYAAARAADAAYVACAAARAACAAYAAARAACAVDAADAADAAARAACAAYAAARAACAADAAADILKIVESIFGTASKEHTCTD